MDNGMHFGGGEMGQKFVSIRRRSRDYREQYLSRISLGQGTMRG